MHLGGEAAIPIRPIATIGTAFPHGAATMAIDAFGIVAADAVLARCLPGNDLELGDFVFRRLGVVFVRAGIVGTVAAQEMRVAEFQHFDALDFGVVVFHRRVEPLAVFVARDARYARRCGARG